MEAAKLCRARTRAQRPQCIDCRRWLNVHFGGKQTLGAALLQVPQLYQYKPVLRHCCHRRYALALSVLSLASAASA